MWSRTAISKPFFFCQSQACRASRCTSNRRQVFAVRYRPVTHPISNYQHRSHRRRNRHCGKKPKLEIIALERTRRHIEEYQSMQKPTHDYEDLPTRSQSDCRELTFELPFHRKPQQRQHLHLGPSRLSSCWSTSLSLDTLLSFSSALRHRQSDS